MKNTSGRVGPVAVAYQAGSGADSDSSDRFVGLVLPGDRLGLARVSVLFAGIDLREFVLVLDVDGGGDRLVALLEQRRRELLAELPGAVGCRVDERDQVAVVVAALDEPETGHI